MLKEFFKERSQMKKYYNLVRDGVIYNRILQSIETANGITFATMNLCKENKSLEPTKAVKEKLILITPFISTRDDVCMKVMEK